MRKLLAVFRIAWQYALASRMRIVFWLAIDILIPVVLSLLFKIIYPTPQSTIAGLNYSQFIQYLLLATLIKVTLITYPSEEVSERIWRGTLSKNLLKPMSFPLYLITAGAGWRLFSVILIIPLFILISLALNLKIIFISNLISLVFILFSLIIGFITFWIFDFTFGLTAFWLTDISGIQNLKGVMFMLLAGQFIPPQFLPLWLQKINQFLPFQYFLAFPVRLIQQTINSYEIIKSFAILFIYLIIFAFLARRLWRQGLKQYSAVGI